MLENQFSQFREIHSILQFPIIYKVIFSFFVFISCIYICTTACVLSIILSLEMNENVIKFYG